VSFNRVSCNCCAYCASGCTTCDLINSVCQSAAIHAGCSNFTATFSATIGLSGGQGSWGIQWGNVVPGQIPNPCGGGIDCTYHDTNSFWEFDVTLPIVFDGKGVAQWHLSDGFVEFVPDGIDCECGGGCYYIKKLGETTATCCDIDVSRWPTCETMEVDDFTVGIYVVSQDWEAEQASRFHCTSTIDTDPKDAFTVEHDGTTGSPTDVLLNVGVSGLSIEFIGGDYDGYICSIPIKNEADIPVACINAIGKGISATALTSEVLGSDNTGGSSGLKCNELIPAEESILGSTYTVTYTDEDGFFTWRPLLHIIAIPDMDSNYAGHEAAASGTCGVTPPSMVIISEPPEFLMAFEGDANSLICRCDEGQQDKSVCPQNQEYTLDTSHPSYFTCHDSECQQPATCANNIYNQEFVIG